MDTQANKKIMREVKIRGKGVKKRCRKESYILITEYAENDKEALQKCNDRIKELNEKYRSYTLNDKVEAYNITLNIYEDYTAISRLMYPQFSKECDYKEYDLIAI